MSDQTDVILRLRGAVPTKARRDELFAGIVAEWARDAGVPLEDVTAEDRAKLRPQFDANLLATVRPPDVIAACRMVQSPSQVVRDLKLGSSRADHFERDGTPKVVWILARDLEHLLAALPPIPEAPCPTSSPTPSTGSGTSNTPIAPEPSPTSGEPTASP